MANRSLFSSLITVALSVLAVDVDGLAPVKDEDSLLSWASWVRSESRLQLLTMTADFVLQ